MRRGRWILLTLVLVAAAGLAWIAARPSVPAAPASAAAAPAAPAATARFVGSTACGACHEAQSAAWRGSQHAHAMQHASAETVRGDFDDARLVFQGVTSTFFRRDGRFFVRTDGPDGALADFEVKYTFGLEPLQQYLVELPGGRLQALALSWDARPRDAGGQRWFRQYPGEKIDHRDELHWTRRSQNWNVMCADCHSTNVSLGYDAARGSFSTRYSELVVGCEACHGPGSAHLEWAKDKPAADRSKGLAVALDERRGVGWTIDAASGNARRSVERRTGREIEVCAPCHARRAQIGEGHRAGHALMDHYLPSRLAEGLYHVDGQQRDEVFVWASFLQSRMHAAGVTCSDCHDPHTQKLRAPGNAICGQCHAGAKYDGAQHHFHRPATAGAQCVACHMPATTYMVVDPRRDHSLRVPRPDLAAELGTPDACSGCHRDRTPRWAAAAVARWYGPARRQEAHFGQALAAARRAAPGAAAGLLAIVGDARQPAIVRASAIDELARYPGAAAAALVVSALADADPLVRHAAVQALPSVASQASALVPLLRDPVRAVRGEAAVTLLRAGVPVQPPWAAALEDALRELESGQRENLSTPEGWTNLGNLLALRRDAVGAERAFRGALELDPRYAPAWVNLADLYRTLQRDGDGAQLLREAVRRLPAAPALREALGLTLVRQGDKRAALAEFAAAHGAAPADPRHAYVYALALADAGRRPEALRVLDASARRGGGRDVLLALASLRRDGGDERGAREALAALAAVNPDDPALPQR